MTVKSEIAAGTRGASMGPDAIKVAAPRLTEVTCSRRSMRRKCRTRTKQLFDVGKSVREAYQGGLCHVGTAANAVKNSLKG